MSVLWRAAVTTAATCAVVTAGALTAGALLSRTLTAPPSPRQYRTAIHSHDADQDTVVLARDEYTEQPGEYGLYLDNGAHITVGALIGEDARTVTRIIRRAGPQGLERARFGAWSGIVHPNPLAAGIDVVEVLIPTPAGDTLAWLAGGSDVWAIHIHGMGGTRASTLRGFALTARLGLTSLAVSYRNTAEGPRVGNGRNSLGTHEAADVEAAIDYAVAQGARTIVLVGWSMGAAIALQVAAGRHGPLIGGAILDSPVLDWRGTVRAELAAKSWPSVLAWTVEPWLASATMSRLIGIPSTGGLRAFDWSRKADRFPVRALIMQGASDSSVPDAVARKLAAARPDLITLAMWEGRHTTLWNVDPSRWEATVEDWLEDQKLV